MRSSLLSEVVSTKVIGIDIDEEMINVCKDKVKNYNIAKIELMNGDVSTEDTTFVSVDSPGSQESKDSMNLKTIQEASIKLFDYIINLDYVEKNNAYVIRQIRMWCQQY